MHVNLIRTGLFKLFHQVAHSVRGSSDLQAMLKEAVDSIGWGFELDRCLILLHEGEELEVKAEFSRDSSSLVGPRRYQLWSNSEWHRLLTAGKPVPLKEISLETGQPGELPEFDRFVSDSFSQSVVAFPLVQESLLGCLTMHYCREAKSFSDELLEVGEAIAEELAMAVDQSRLLLEKDLEGRVFRDAPLPFLVVDPQTYRILQANKACRDLMSPQRNDLRGALLAEFLAESDYRRVQEAAGTVGRSKLFSWLNGLVARKADGGTVLLNASISAFESEGQPAILLTLMPQSASPGKQPPADPSSSRSESTTAKLEEMVTTLSRQLNWERLTRRIISMVHSTLDRDAVLQITADALGRALGASRCLIVRTDGPVSLMVTHEYVEPDISPLGLGRTSQFPLNAISFFRNKTMQVTDLSADFRPPGLSQDDLNELIESGVRSMLGAPISHHGVSHGVVILLQTDRTKSWSAQELELLESVVEQAGVSLNHVQSYVQTKDQLFNMNLIGNLTQQLTNALDLAAKAGKPGGSAEPAKPPGTTTPLSLRELEVLKLIASGLANREIAQRLFLTESTVELHASRIRKKLKLKSRTALVKYACDNHLV